MEGVNLSWTWTEFCATSDAYEAKFARYSGLGIALVALAELITNIFLAIADACFCGTLLQDSAKATRIQELSRRAEDLQTRCCEIQRQFEALGNEQGSVVELEELVLLLKQEIPELRTLVREMESLGVNKTQIPQSFESLADKLQEKVDALAEMMTALKEMESSVRELEECRESFSWISNAWNGICSFLQTPIVG